MKIPIGEKNLMIKKIHEIKETRSLNSNQILMNIAPNEESTIKQSKKKEKGEKRPNSEVEYLKVLSQTMNELKEQSFEFCWKKIGLGGKDFNFNIKVKEFQDGKRFRYENKLPKVTQSYLDNIFHFPNLCLRPDVDIHILSSKYIEQQKKLKEKSDLSMSLIKSFDDAKIENVDGFYGFFFNKIENDSETKTREFKNLTFLKQRTSIAFVNTLKNMMDAKQILPQSIPVQAPERNTNEEIDSDAKLLKVFVSTARGEIITKESFFQALKLIQLYQ